MSNPYDVSTTSPPAGAPSNDPESLTTADWVLAILCSGIGCIIGIIRVIQGKKNGVKMLGISFGMVIVWNIVRFAIEMIARQ